MNNTWNYFNESDDPLIVGAEPELMSMLDMARGKSGVPYTLTCVLRSAAHNSALKGAVCDSAHLADAHGLSQAADIACGDDHMAWCMIFGLMMAGFRRIGIYCVVDPHDALHLMPCHLHVDIDTTKPPEVMWFLIEQN